jgi:hypothetical protein
MLRSVGNGSFKKIFLILLSVSMMVVTECEEFLAPFFSGEVFISEASQTQIISAFSQTFHGKLSEVVELGGDTIRLSRNSISFQDIKTLSCVERLRVVRITGERLSSQAAIVFASMPHLEQLHLVDIEIDDDFLANLTTSRSLWLLNLRGKGFSEKGIKALSKCQSLRQLRLVIPGVGDSFASAVSFAKTLRQVHLIGGAITDNGLQLLACLPFLESLYLDDAVVSEDGLISFVENNRHIHLHIDQLHLPLDLLQ